MATVCIPQSRWATRGHALPAWVCRRSICILVESQLRATTSDAIISPERGAAERMGAHPISASACVTPAER
jgi:hypothetical protein